MLSKFQSYEFIPLDFSKFFYLQQHGNVFLSYFNVFTQ